jgi:RNA polymerase sigma factor (TIGR02999 family)
MEPGEDEAGLVGVVYDELRALASAYLRNERPGHTLQTTALVHEAWLRLSSRDARQFNSRAHYFRAAALAMRRILLHHAEKSRAQKRGTGNRGLSLNESDLPGEVKLDADPLDLIALDEALHRLAELDPQKAHVVELRFFGGCSIDETAEALGVGTATVERDWRFARAWLRTALDGADAAPHDDASG